MEINKWRKNCIIPSEFEHILHISLLQLLRTSIVRRSSIFDTSLPSKETVTDSECVIRENLRELTTDFFLLQMLQNQDTSCDRLSAKRWKKMIGFVYILVPFS